MSDHIKIDYESPIPIYEQIKQGIRIQIINGTYKKEDRLISIRELAQMLQINQNTILKAYYQLEVEGYVYSKPGQGYYVKEIKDMVDTENKKLFGQLTDEYVNRALSLGFSIKDIISEIRERR